MASLLTVLRGSRLFSSLCKASSSSMSLSVQSSKQLLGQPTELMQRDYFGLNGLFTVEDLFNARVHLGHSVSSLESSMSKFVYGSRFNQCVIDLDATALHLRQALNFVAHLVSRGGLVLFVCQQQQLTHVVETTAVECGEYAHCRSWDRKTFMAPRDIFQTDIRMPDVLIFLHTRTWMRYEEHEAIANAASIGIPTVAVVDSDCNPSIISYPVPGNDDSMSAVKLYLKLFKEAILRGKRNPTKGPFFQSPGQSTVA